MCSENRIQCRRCEFRPKITESISGYCPVCAGEILDFLNKNENLIEKLIKVKVINHLAHQKIETFKLKKWR